MFFVVVVVAAVFSFFDGDVVPVPIGTVSDVAAPGRVGLHGQVGLVGALDGARPVFSSHQLRTPIGWACSHSTHGMWGYRVLRAVRVWLGCGGMGWIGEGWGGIDDSWIWDWCGGAGWARRSGGGRRRW